MSIACRRLAFAALLALLPALALAERGWVANRDGTTINIFDTATNTEDTATNPVTGSPNSPLTVGTGPVDIATDQPDSAGPTQLYVVNAGSNTVSVIRAADLIVSSTVSGGGRWGTFETPSGAALVLEGSLGPSIAVVDQKLTSDSSVAFWTSPNGRSTIRFLDPTSNTVATDLREASGSARYNDVVFTSNRRLWIADDGDQGIVVVRLGATDTGIPDFPSTNLIYNGTNEFADFITDRSATRTYLLAPRRLATNGTSRVVAVDGASDIVTVIDANYTADNESGAVLQNVDLGLAAGVFASDVEVIGNFAYVTSTASPGQVYRIDLVTYAVTTPAGPAIATTVAGLGATSDGATLYAGGGTGVATITPITVGTFTTGATFTLTGGSFPFAFYSSTINPTPVPSGVVTGGSAQPGPQWVGGIPGSSSGGGAGGEGENETCGLLGAEVLLLLAGLRFLRRR